MIRILMFLLLFAFANTSIAEDWPRWRGPRSNGTWNAPGPFGQSHHDDIDRGGGGGFEPVRERVPCG